jgi:hypothetical protein
MVLDLGSLSPIGSWQLGQSASYVLLLAALGQAHMAESTILHRCRYRHPPQCDQCVRPCPCGSQIG